ncbi:MAG: MGH1-like glycoside hydrolase domain-containing protein [Candidatus Aminicenantales bacterium]
MRSSLSLYCLLFLLGLPFFYLVSCQPGKEEKNQKPTPRSHDYAYRWVTRAEKILAEEGKVISLKLNLVNVGRRSWNSNSPKAPCLLSYHLLDGQRRLLRFENPRFALPGEINPGQKAEVNVSLLAPLKAGKYYLEFDLVLEGRSWFREYGSKTLLLPLEVKAVHFPEDGRSPTLEQSPYTLFLTESNEFNLLLRLIRLTLHHDKVEFQGKSGPVVGFMAGSGYPQVWVRDSATIIPASRYYYPRPYLLSWLEEILSFQDENGSLPDWVDASGRVDKNTTESDQEASAVQAAAAVVRVIGKEEGAQWLKKKIGSQRVMDRLEQALRFLLEFRTDPESGLITGAHTADWGDVESGDPDHQAIYADSKTCWTIDIYDQSMFYQAALDIAYLWEVAGETRRGAFWKERAELIKSRTNQYLWQEDKGFYRVHRHVDSSSHGFPEDDIFAMGGNTQAILSGLATAEQARQIIQEALRRQQAFGMSTISGSLLPPYPDGFFNHPMMDQAYEYQNGGQWDWFGGRLIAAMYEFGFSEAATRSLLDVARKNLERGGFYEWDTREGHGRGSQNYAGSAGALALALVEGFLGIQVSREVPVLSPRIGWGKAKVQVYIPASRLFYAYDYSCKKSGQLDLRFNSNDPRPGLVRLLWPWGKSASSVLWLDGKKIEPQKTTIGSDFYLIIPTDFVSHHLEAKVH